MVVSSPEWNARLAALKAATTDTPTLALVEMIQLATGIVHWHADFVLAAIQDQHNERLQQDAKMCRTVSERLHNALDTAEKLVCYKAAADAAAVH